MKRISTVLGRIGTVLLALCLALAILVLIPPANLGISTSGASQLNSETFTLIGGSSLSLNPQIFVKVSLDVNTTIEFYIINILQQKIIEEAGFYNLTKFDNFMQDNADKILLNGEVSKGSTTLEFTPNGLVNATFIIVNRNVHAASVNYKIELLTSIAPKVRIIPTITYLGPIGAVLTGQWVFVEIKNRKREKLA
ncbi:hypothetical protein J7K06_06755 [Candidatus Bathyarchaeota archaeon]|nr:hypothetical protein [Candidatus Bathyarchaeota archaeon]